MANKKAVKLGRALRTAARLPARVSGGRGSGRNTFSPTPGETPVVLLRVQVLGCSNLLAKDKNGFSDPFVVVSLLRDRHRTPVIKRSLNPQFAATSATFDFPIYMSLAEKLGVIEFVVWDKDMIKKDYLGEACLPLEDWFRDDNAFAFNDPDNKIISTPLVSARTSTHATGTVQFKLGFVCAPGSTPLMDYGQLFSELNKRARPSLVSAPPTEGIGTVRSHQGGPAFEDDGLTSDEGEYPSDEEDEEPESYITAAHTPAPAPGSSFTRASPPALPPLQALRSPPLAQPLPRTPSTPSTPTARAAALTPILVKPPSPLPSSFAIPKIFPRRKSTMRSTSADASAAPSPGPSTPRTPSLPLPRTPTTPALPRTPTSPMSATTSQAQAQQQATKTRFRRSWVAAKAKDFNFSAANDIMGIVMLEIQNAHDLPRLKNMTRTGFDMDPFVVVSFGKKVFRTRVIRHSLNPTWDEKLLFHVRRYETAFKIQLTVLDWDKLSSNDHVGDASLDVSDLIANAPQKDPVTGLYPAEQEDAIPMKDFSLPLSTTKEMPWEAIHRPVLHFRAKYQPYDALRQRFWRQYLKQYEVEDMGLLSHVEISSMLDSLGSTLSHETISSFFTRFGKRPQEDMLTTNEVIQCLETELCRPRSEKKRINFEDDTSAPVTPAINGHIEGQGMLNLDQLDFSGPPLDLSTFGLDSEKPQPPSPHITEPMQRPLLEAAASSNSAGTSFFTLPNQQSPGSYSDAEDSSGSASSQSKPNGSSSSSPNGSDSTATNSDDHFERVINVKNCPLCHRPRLNSKAEVDIVTHLAICASQDWAAVDRIMVGNFVTASQAQRKWYTKVISKVSSGNYKLGANSANIIVQNRLTGQLEEEKMQVYVRLGIRLLYKGWKSRMEGGRARRLLKSMSIKQGIKYDSPESARYIPTFITFHNLKVNEIEQPVSSFKTFNQFFYRKLKPDARPVESLDNPYRLVSCADCRLMVFDTVREATTLWIKGREFTVSRLLGDAYKHEAERYVNGALCIFRLAPQDYHRFHSPVDGTVGAMTYIAGEYYTVNPQAIRTALDVYGENARKVIPIDSPQFGRVMIVAVGAMMVGTIKTTVAEGEQVKRGQELGYFAFGGSTLVVLFEKGVVEWDEDLLINGHACLETLVRVGMGIGRGLRGPH